MLRLVVFAVVVVAAHCTMMFGGWEDFKRFHSKKYGHEEDMMRQGIYEYNRKFIARHNFEYKMGKHTFMVGENQFADWTNTEFQHFMNGFRMSGKKLRSRGTHRGPLKDLPAMVDWRTQGYVTPIKNQMQCGSCWAFSATGALEGQWFKKTGNLVSLSEQNLVDCSRPEGNMGCQGGLMDQAFEYIKINNGDDTEESYPYTAMNGECMFNPATVGATDTGFMDIPSMDEMALQSAVANVGPISVAMDASRQSFQLYTSGVYSDPECSSTVLDHGVLAIGYGMDQETGQAYWLVKNSWGTTWGMKGFFKMARNMNNMCGIATSASYPTV